MTAIELREQLAADINFEGELNRNMAFREPQEFRVGQVLTLGRSWAYDGGTYNTWGDFGKCEYNFHLKNGKGHKIDYSSLTEDEMWTLGCEDCETENEVLISGNQLFKITEIWGDETFEEMGFVVVEVEMFNALSACA